MVITNCPPDPRFLFQARNAECPVLNVGCESDPTHFGWLEGTVNMDIDDWSGTTSKFMQHDACAPWPLEDKSFDTVVFGDSLDHMDDPQAALREGLRVARRAVIVSLPDEAPTCDPTEVERHVVDLKAMGLKDVAPGDLGHRHAHHVHWTEQAVRDLLAPVFGTELELAHIPSGPPEDRHWYWGVVIRVDNTPSRVTTPEDLPFVSILCPSYRPGGLNVLFSGLGKQTYGGPWEVVMVDELYAMPGRGEAVGRAAMSAGVAVRHLPNPRSIFPRCSTVTARNEAIVAARGELAIWLTDYSAVRPDFILQHVAAHAQHGYDKKVVINGAFYNVWPPELALDLRNKVPLTPERLPGLAGRETLYAESLTAAAAWRLPLQNRTHAGNWWTRDQTGQDEASFRYVEGEVGAGYHFMKHDSIWLETLRAVGGLEEAFLGLHKYDDTDIGARLELYGCRFYHSKRPAIRHLQMRHLMRHLEIPPDAEERGKALLVETGHRIAAGIFTPRETHPALARST